MIGHTVFSGAVLVFCLIIISNGLRVKTKQQPASTLSLPANATSIREEISDNFSCANRSYGYYADVANECQVFHVCLPVVYANGKEQMFRWSFICPEETQFNQEDFTCARAEDSIPCAESEQYYELNSSIGATTEAAAREASNNTVTSSARSQPGVKGTRTRQG